MTSTLSNSETTPHLESAKIAWFRHQLQTWAADNLRDFPWRHTTDPYSIFGEHPTFAISRNTQDILGRNTG